VSRIVINVRETTWVEIRNSSGKAIISQVLNPGEQYNVPNEDGMVLATGNIGGLEFVVDGQPIPPLGNKGDVARGIKLNADAMKPKGKAAAPAAFTTTTQPYNAAATPAQDAAWQAAVRPGAASRQPSATVPAQKYVRPEDRAYKPGSLPGASSGRVGMDE
jgi:cytoskeleton protein RodZ